MANKESEYFQFASKLQTGINNIEILLNLRNRLFQQQQKRCCMINSFTTDSR